MSGTPAAEVNIDERLIRALLLEQHPDLAHLPCMPVDAGWDNVMVRLGDSLCLRLPRRAAAASLIENEQAWLPGLSKALPLPIPVPLRVGLPAAARVKNRGADAAARDNVGTGCCRGYL